MGTIALDCLLESNGSKAKLVVYLITDIETQMVDVIQGEQIDGT
jgi:hypothetical protein